MRLMIAGLAIAALAGCTETLETGVERGSQIHNTGHLNTQKVDCSSTAGCWAMIRGLEGGTRADAVVRMPSGCYHTVTTINPVVEQTASAPAEDFVPTRYRRVQYKRPASIPLDRYELEQLAGGATLDVAFICETGEPNRLEQISFPADQVQELNSLLVDPPVRIN